MKNFQRRVLIICILVSGLISQDSFKVATIISDGMVLQQGESNTIWGWAESDSKVAIKADWLFFKRTTRTNKEGEWKIALPAPELGGPYTFEVLSGSNRQSIQNVMCGEVWLASGQSNMEMALKRTAWNEAVDDYERHVSEADLPEIRLFKVMNNFSLQPEKDVQGSWIVCTPETVPDFSATPYFYAKSLFDELQIPIGIINSSWGGTPAESWTKPSTMRDLGIYDEQLDVVYAEENTFDPERFSRLMENWVKGRDSVYTDSSHRDLAGLKLNDESWDETFVPGSWGTGRVPDMDGVIWFRQKVAIPHEWKDQELTLNLGPIDDYDQVYWNGRLVGGMGPDVPNVWIKPREYDIPAELTRSEENLIAVRIFDDKGGGGFWGQDSQYSIGPVKLSIENHLSLAGNWKFQIESKFEPPPVSPLNQNSPGVLFHAMIWPLRDYSIRGAIWYQGESNHMRGIEYGDLFPAMIEDWRMLFERGDFPFYYVQIAPFNYAEKGSLPVLWEAQANTLKKLENLGMVVTTDIGDLNDIHPTNKYEVGRRLGLWALANTYARDDVVYCGPMFSHARTMNGSIQINFTKESVAGGLVIDGDSATCFEIAGMDGIFYPASVSIDGPSLLVSHPEISQPAFVRFAWSNTAEPNLFNTAGLPAAPFRTSQLD